MKKVKIMLLSLALLAVVGGALAFKAKYSLTFCTTTAYWDTNGYYCSYSFGLPIQTTTKHCPNLLSGNCTYQKDIDAYLQRVCTITANESGQCPGDICETELWTTTCN